MTSQSVELTRLRTDICRLLVICLSLTSVSGLEATSGYGFRKSPTETCGHGCRCNQNATIANCSYSRLDEIPSFPVTTRVLVIDFNNIKHLGDFLGALPSTTSPLEVLSLSHNNISVISPAALRGMRALRKLRLNDNRIEQLPAAIFADTSLLTALSLAGNGRLDLDSLGAALHPSRLPLLRLLDLSRTRVGDRIPETVFTELPSLEHLIMRDVAIANMSADFLTALGNGSLTSLDLTGSSVGDVDVAAFAPVSTSMRQLVLDSTLISPQALDAIFHGLTSGNNDSQLELLSIKNVFVDESHDSAVGPHLFRNLANAKLRTLHMDSSYAGLHGKIPGRLLHAVKHLQLLTLTGCGLRAIPDNAFHGLRHLQKLDLRHNQLSCARQDDCAFMTSSVGSLPHLHTLDLSDNLLVSAQTQGVDGGSTRRGVRFPDDVFPALIELDLTGNRLTSVGVGMFGRLDRLQTLRLSDNPLEEVEAGAMEGLTALTRLEMDGCRMLTHLRAGALAGLSRLKVLSVQDSALVHLHHTVFAHLTHLEELYLRNNHLGDQGSSLEKLTSKQTRLRVVDLGSNRLTTLPTGLLSSSPRLNTLYVDDNRLTDCQQTAAVLSSVSELEFLDLSFNHFVQLDVECFRGVGVSVKLVGNPWQCSCKTAEGARRLRQLGVLGPNIVDRDVVACTGPSDRAGVRLLGSGSDDGLPSAWECRWRGDVVVSVLVLLALTIVVIIAVRVRHHCITHGKRSLHTSHNGSASVSSVTISNSCYGNGTAVSGTSTQAGGGEVGTRYSPLIEDDVISASANGTTTDTEPLRRRVEPQISESGPRSAHTVAPGRHRKQQAPSSGNDPSTATPSCGDIDNEALLGCDVTDMEESV